MHLLLIEDDLELGAALQHALVARGFSSEWLRHAADAIRWLDNAKASAACICAVLDLGLPDGDGLAVLATWRRRRLTLPVIVLTARDAVADRVAGLDAGADDYVVKPVAPEELVARILAVTRRASGQTSGRWTVGALQIDPGRREVWRDGEPVALSRREFDIVAELARQPGHVVPKHRLASALVPLGDPLDFNAIEFHVHRLRRKLGEDCIQTVRGVGYRMAD
ncbi:response regulator [Chitinolyticbacter meiyuanensis]|uniref:response regulator n=1 Tax=Chitinolyticbacter meiyuanensis TaxID=682798 RepID=UPI0011E59675|nr:response regulator [Chitinolyticbacter meiyuanensis]